MAVDIDSIDLSIQQSIPGIEELENINSWQFSYFCSLVRYVRRMVYLLKMKRKNWAIDTEFMQLSRSIAALINDLPFDLQVMYPADDSAPWISSHFVGNLHIYYHLSIILLHRAQLAFSDSYAADGRWKERMMTCNRSAKLACRLQEAIIQEFGWVALLYMQRGVNFAIYVALTCIVLHLVSLLYLRKFTLTLLGGYDISRPGSEL
jgi:hypothetical protein